MKDRQEALVRLIPYLLVLVTVLAFSQVSGNDFVQLDDQDYVYLNTRVTEGLSINGVFWAFTSTFRSNWHPLAWLSHMMDVQMFGLNPVGHHLVSLLFHALNSLLLFRLLRKITGSEWRSAFVAALFAVHPLHVESVAWAAERKDVLCAFFWMLAMLAYIGYVERPRIAGYLSVALLFAFALLSKAMAVTFPFVLLLLDRWPLERTRKIPFARLLLEKAPLMALSAIAGVVAYRVQESGGAVSSIENLSIWARVGNAIAAYAAYIGKMFWPSSLAVFYPHPGNGLPLRQVALSLAMLGLVTFLAFLHVRRRPYLAVGWLWFLGTLVPVIGLVQVGGQAMADRYTYLPLIGIFIVVSWGAPEVIGGWRYRTHALALLGSAAIIACAAASRVQVSYWRNSEVLFRHTVRVTDGNWRVHEQLGNILVGEGKVEEGIAHYRESVRIRPDFLAARYNLGTILLREGRTREAIVEFQEVLKIRSDFAPARNNLGFALMQEGAFEEAAGHFREAVRIDPGFTLARRNLESALEGISLRKHVPAKER